MVIEPEFHPMIIGKKGETVRNLRNKFGVQVNLPRRGEGNNENIVTVVGYQQSAESARDEIQEMVDKLVSLFLCCSLSNHFINNVRFVVDLMLCLLCSEKCLQGRDLYRQ